MRRAAVALAIFAATMALSSAPGRAGAREASVARWVDVTGECDPAGVGLQGSLELRLADGDVVAHSYAVSDGAGTVGLGADSVVAAAVDRTAPYQDVIVFGPRRAGGYPYTYTQQVTVTSAGAVVYAQELVATCVADGAAEVVVHERPVPPSPGPGADGDVPVVPRFAG